jgi:glutamyl/glutaminyl-tRNA synthetase
MPVAQLAGRLGERLVAKGWLPPDYDRAWLERIAALVRDRLKVLREIEDEHAFFFQEPAYQEDAVAKFLRQDAMAPRLLALRERLSALPAFDASSVEAAVRGYCQEQGMEAKALVHPVRVAVTGRPVSPPLFEVMSILGKERVVRRLEHAATALAA